MRSMAVVCLFTLIMAACTDAPTPSVSVAPPGILIIQPGEKVQIGPPTEDLKVVMSNLLVMADNHGNDVGYPWFDATTGEIVASVVTPRGRQLIDAALIGAPHRFRQVAHAMGDGP